MSILIKGMEMPKAGQLLQVAENVNGTIFIRETTQGEWHQVVEVPTPHGKLVDADAAMRQGWTINRTYSASATENVYEVRALDTLPTIIEAEGSNYDWFYMPI